MIVFTQFQQVNERLELFGVKPVEDIIGTTTDGARVCKKYGRELGVIHQLCYDLAIQRAIYKKVDEDSAKQRKARRIVKPSEYDSDATESDEDNDEDETFSYKPDFGNVINKVRGIVKIFKKSPKLNDMLQDFVLEERQTKLQLVLDVRTRWHSMVLMLQTFARIAGPVKKALTALNCLEMWSSDILMVIGEISEPLSLAKMAMDAISRDDANLLTAEGTFEWLFEELKRMNTALSQDLLVQLEVELDQRRQLKIVSLMKFFQNPKSLEEINSSYFDMPPKREVFATATSLWNKYFAGKPIVIDNNNQQSTRCV